MVAECPDYNLVLNQFSTQSKLYDDYVYKSSHPHAHFFKTYFIWIILLILFILMILYIVYKKFFKRKSN